MPHLGGHGNGERTEDNVPEAGLAALCPAAIRTIVALVCTALMMLTAIARMTKPDGGLIAER